MCCSLSIYTAGQSHSTSNLFTWPSFCLEQLSNSCRSKGEKTGNTQIWQHALIRLWWMGGCTKPIDEEWHTKYVPWHYLLLLVQHSERLLLFNSSSKWTKPTLYASCKANKKKKKIQTQRYSSRSYKKIKEGFEIFRSTGRKSEFKE